MSFEEIKLQGNIQSSKSDSVELLLSSVVTISVIAFIVSYFY
jgi:hypothetical protein